MGRKSGVENIDTRKKETDEEENGRKNKQQRIKLMLRVSNITRNWK